MPKKTPLSPSGCRNKGAGAERELAKILGQATGAEFLRNLEQSRGGGFDIGSESYPWLALEIKRCEKVCLSKWLIQAARQAGEGQIPALAFRQNRRPWSFVVPLATVNVGAPPSALCHLDLTGFVWWLSFAPTTRQGAALNETTQPVPDLVEP